MAKAFSIEDGNLATTSLVGSSAVKYKDIDLSFTAKKSGDLYNKTDAAAVKQAVKNLLLRVVWYNVTVQHLSLSFRRSIFSWALENTTG